MVTTRLALWVAGAAAIGVACAGSAAARHAPPARAIASDFRMSGNPSLPGRCALSRLAPAIAATLGAFNAGRGRAFALRFVERLEFQPYNGYPSRRYKAGSRAGVAAIVQQRHAAGDGWTAFDIVMPQAIVGESATFNVGLRVRAGGSTFEQGVKVVMHCRTGQIRAWRGPAWSPAG